MVMDDMFGFIIPDLTLGEPDSVFGFDEEVSTMEKSDDAGLAVPDLPPINLEELEFDFEDMKDFGPWIETDVNNTVEPEPCKPEALSERLNFKDLEIKEAVRYDCMWSSYNEFNQDTKSVKSKNYPNNSSNTANAANTDNNTSLTLSNSFYDSLLNSFETPSCTESDSTSDRSSDMETDEDSENSISEKQTMYTNIKDIENRNNSESSYHSSVRLFASLDHCYNISSTQLDNEKFLNNSNGPLTPPMSSDDEDSSSNQTNFKFDSSKTNSSQTKAATNNKVSFIRTKASNVNKSSSQSLLKKSYTKASSEAKFSFKLNLKANDNKNSRSLLKQRIQKVKIIKAPFKGTEKSGLKQKLEGSRSKNCQSAIRKRKERSLKMQEGEAREIHNQMERQRRNELKLSFDKLKTVLPELATSDKASKQQILDKAVETVKMIKSTEASLSNRRNNLNKSNTALQEKLRLLKEDILKSENFNLGIDKW